ncbi:MobA/MobL family protein, partial [Escherichia coli]|uniref:MobA/MobL family protein n=1 Tax=Escherichia coli TaxID=562 RepID=UPI002180ACB2
MRASWPARSNARLAWADHANRALERAGHDARIDHRTLEAQGIERLPGVHL